MSSPYESPTDIPFASAVPDSTNGKAVASLVLGIASFLFSFLASIPALILGIISLGEIGRSGGRIGGRGMATTGIVLSVLTLAAQALLVPIALLIPAVSAVREAARRSSSTARMSNIGMAMQMYHDVNNRLPAAADASSGVPVSWRVHMLPHLEQQRIYQRYDLHQPWDSAANRSVKNTRVSVYENPNDPAPQWNRTNYLAVVGPGTAFEPGQPLTLNSLKAPALTILFVEADEDQAVPWAQPKDLDFDPADPLRGVGHFRPSGIVAAFGDATVRTLSPDIDLKVFRALVERSDEAKDKIPPDFDEPTGSRRIR